MSLFKGMLTKNRAIGAAVIAAALFAPAIASAATAYVSASVNVRSGPGANYGRLAALPAGATVNAGSCRNGWCQIYNGNRVGWVSARYVRFGAYSGPAYAAPSNTTVIVNNDGYADGLGVGIALGWATGGYWGPGWGPGWGGGWGPGWRGGPNYINGCIGRNCQSNRGGWNNHWGRGPQWNGRGGWGGRGWPQGQIRRSWGPGPVMSPGGFAGFNRPAFVNRGFGGGGFGGGMHFGNVRPMHAGR
ncbi:SH3 domain-containing protein [Ochrobactrum sp. CGA5]|uniref:SH3 domain-containing protein n=1 Tax=Ochrobactrum sp. CGA5 TaxID=2583453 RepID=UPI00111E472B|nr:SH3 domain-containing protein [Ochrobactrum sp. CGA5]